jgi:signal transduction histidine kinase
MNELLDEVVLPVRRQGWAQDPGRLFQLLAINRAIVSTLEFAALPRLVIEKTAAFTHADCCVLLLATESNVARVAASVGIDTALADRFSAPLDERVDGALRGLLGGGARGTLVSVPVMNHGNIEGLLAVGWVGEFEVGNEEQYLLSALADMAAIALGHAAGYEKMYLAERAARASAERAVRSRDELVDQLERKTVLLEAVMDQIPVGIAIAQASSPGQIWSNPRLDEISRRARPPQPHPAEQWNAQRTDGSVLPLPDRPIFRAIAGHATANEAVRIVRGDGSAVIVEVSASPVLDSKGHVTAAVSVVQDITERAEQEAERARLLANERAALAALATTARAESVARARAEESDRRKEEFLAMLAHELRNPLAALTNAFALWDRGTTAGSYGRTLRETCTRQVRHLTRMVDDLLDVSRVSSSRVELRKQRLDLGAVLRSAVESVQPMLDDRKHWVSVQLEAGELVLDADPTRLEQVVCNLLINAAKYTPSGGRIWLRARREKRDGAPWVAIHVKDTGVGLSEDMLSKVFDLFVQVDTSLQRSEGGLGIGLTLVKGLVEAHGGSVWATSEGLGKGSEFIVRLPLSTTREAAAVPPQSAPLPAQQVLVVEDSREIRETLKLLLEELGNRVETVGDGLGAVERALALRPDVSLIDVGLPGIDGYEVARRIRAAPGGGGLFLVALTGYSGPVAEAKSREAGFDRHVVKPIDVDRLGDLLRRPD